MIEKAVEMAIKNRAETIVKSGSDSFTYPVPTITAGGTNFESVDVETIFPRSRQWLPLDFLEVQNNTYCALAVYLNGPNELYSVPAYMQKRITKPFRRLQIVNLSPTDDAAGIILHMKRLPKETEKVVEP